MCRAFLLSIKTCMDIAIIKECYWSLSRKLTNYRLTCRSYSAAEKSSW
jgi:hypothetical protein